MILPCGHVANRKWKQGAEHWCSEPTCRRWYRMTDEAPSVITVDRADLLAALTPAYAGHTAAVERLRKALLP